jgi:hypothetical protein
LLHHAHFDTKGGLQTFAALRAKVCNADKVAVRRTGSHVCIRERVNFAQHEWIGAD